jgi:hypothetical protein
LKPNAIPVKHAPRQIPEKKKNAFRAELQRLQDQGIIVKEDGHTEWVNSVVPALKADGSIRLCLDPKDLNACLERNAYYIKTVDELSAEWMQFIHGIGRKTRILTRHTRPRFQPPDNI